MRTCWRFSIPAAAKLGLSTTLCSVTTLTRSRESVYRLSDQVLVSVYGSRREAFWFLSHTRWFDDVLVTLIASLVGDRGNEKLLKCRSVCACSRCVTFCMWLCGWCMSMSERAMNRYRLIIRPRICHLSLENPVYKLDPFSQPWDTHTHTH